LFKKVKKMFSTHLQPRKVDCYTFIVKSQSQKATAASQPSHIDRIPEKVLTQVFCAGLVVFAFVWLIIVGSSWASN
jgi:hypothetical protein